MSLDDARKFTRSVYALVETNRPITVYRFYETANLSAPYSKKHPSYRSGSVQNRRPAEMLGGWWSPRRPSLMIDNLGYGTHQRSEDRHRLAVLKEWNRFDTCVEATLDPDSRVYAGRVAPQAENRSFETPEGCTILYGGGAMQFLLVRGASHLHVKREYPIR